MYPRFTRFVSALLALAAFVCVVAACHIVAPVPPQPNRYVVNSPPTLGSYAPDIEPVYIDRDFTPEQHRAIHEALAEWNLALNGYREYQVETDEFAMEVSILQKVVSTNQGLVILSLTDRQLPAGVEDNVLAWVDHLGDPVIFMAVDRFGTRDFKMVVMHEIGHTLGAPHVAMWGSLMSTGYELQRSCVDDVTARTVAAIHASLRWDWHHMNYCESK